MYPLRRPTRCLSTPSLPLANSILTMVKRYPTLFELCCPTTSVLLSVCLAAEETALQSLLAGTIAGKLRWLLLLLSHHRLVLANLLSRPLPAGQPPVPPLQ